MPIFLPSSSIEPQFAGWEISLKESCAAAVGMRQGGQSRQRLDDGEAGEGDLLLESAAFMSEDEAAVAQVGGEGFEAGGDVAEGVGNGGHPGQRVHTMGIKAAGDYDQVGFEGDRSKASTRPCWTEPGSRGC